MVVKAADGELVLELVRPPDDTSDGKRRSQRPRTIGKWIVLILVGLLVTISIVGVIWEISYFDGYGNARFVGMLGLFILIYYDKADLNRHIRGDHRRKSSDHLG